MSTMRRALIGAATVLALAAGAAHAEAVASSGDNLDWSFSVSLVGYAPYVGGTLGSAVYQGMDVDRGVDLNASSSFTDPRWGSATGWADFGEDSLVPDLHAKIEGAAPSGDDVSMGVVGVQGVAVLKWSGGSYDLDPRVLEGVLEYVDTGADFVNAGFAIIDATAFDDDPGLGPAYFSVPNQNVPGASTSAASCSTAGAIGFASTGPRHDTGDVSASAPMAACTTSFHLDNGSEIAFWSKLVAAHVGPGVVDVSDTFGIGFAPGVSEDTQTLLTENFTVAPFAVNPGPIPEPGTWTLLVLGAGGAGAALRRRRKAPAA
jgi:hypothetical protein